MQALVFAAEVDARDVLVVELGGCAGLTLEAGDVLGVGRHLRRQDFQGDNATQLQIGGANDRGHAARSKRFNQFKMAQLPALQTIARETWPIHADDCGRIVRGVALRQHFGNGRKRIVRCRRRWRTAGRRCAFPYDR